MEEKRFPNKESLQKSLEKELMCSLGYSRFFLRKQLQSKHDVSVDNRTSTPFVIFYISERNIHKTSRNMFYKHVISDDFEANIVRATFSVFIALLCNQETDTVGPY